MMASAIAIEIFFSTCGACASCLRRWISLANNGVTTPFDSPPWEWERVQEYYVPAMRQGRYPPHRAQELFTALATVGAAPAGGGGRL